MSISALHFLDKQPKGGGSPEPGSSTSTRPLNRSSDTLSPWSKLIEISIALVVFAVPCVFNPFTNTIFEADKVAVFRSLVILAGCFWVMDQTLNPSRRTARSVGTAFRGLLMRTVLNPVLICTVILAVTYLISTMNSVGIGLSLWGSYDRAQGLMTIAAYLGFFWIALRYLRSPLQAERLVDCIIFASVPVLVYALLQLSGLDPIAWETDSRSSVLSTLGRSNFLGAYIAAVLPLTAWRAVQHPSLKRRFGLSILLFAQLSILVASQARAALLGTIVGMTVLVLIAATSFRSRRMMAISCIVIFISAVVLGGLHLPHIPVAERVGLPGVDGALASSAEAIASARARLIIWRTTIDVILDRPLLGYGPDTLEVVFSRYSPYELAQYLGPSVQVDRAHNLVLDLGATVGVVGIASYLALVIAFLTRALRATLRAPHRAHSALLAAVCASIIVTTVQDQFSFWTVATASLFWLLLAVGTNLTEYLSKSENCPPLDSRQTGEQALVPTGPPTPSGHGSILEVLLRRFAAGAALCLGLAAILWMNVLPMAADVRYNQALVNLAVGRFDEAVRSVEQAIDLSPNQTNQERYHLLLGWVYFQYAAAQGNSLDYLRLSEREVQTAIQAMPHRFSNWLALGQLYGSWATVGDQDIAARAREAYAEAARLSPANPSILAEWGLLCHRLGDFDEAIRRYEGALAIDPNNGQIYEYLGDSLVAVGRYDDAERAFSSAIAHNPESEHAQRSLADLQLRTVR